MQPVRSKNRHELPVPTAAMSKIALITGITGQDGSYLAEFLLARGYTVHGVVRRSSSFGTGRIEHLYRDPHLADTRLFLHYGDVTDGASLRHILTEVAPHEIYNLAAQSHVRVSFEQPVYTVDADALGTLRLLEAIRDTGLTPRFYQAASSEMFGNAAESPQRETTPFRPRSPYGCAKAYGFWQVINYREAYGLFAVNGILFNHESPRRGETFVSRKITRAATRIKEGLQDALYLGNLDARRDWGFAGDYVDAMWRMLQQAAPDDFVVATGQAHSVKDFLEAAFGLLDLDWRQCVKQDPRYMRPTEVDHLLGDASKARRILGWQPTVGFKDLVKMMIEHDALLAREERVLADHRAAQMPKVGGAHPTDEHKL